MKRYRVVGIDFDARPFWLAKAIEDEWDEQVKESWRANKDMVRQQLREQYGAMDSEAKERNFVELGNKPFSVVAFHNDFLEQARAAFLIGAYYPSLTGTCALGERILNHLVLNLRESFRSSSSYKRVRGKDSFDNWNKAISALEDWKVLLPETAEKFRELRDARNRALHFDPTTDADARKPALEAIKLLQAAVSSQFSAFGTQPWFIRETTGEAYIKKEWENDPFVRLIYLPNSALVGPRHTVGAVRPEFKILDDHAYEDREVSDQEFWAMRLEQKGET